MANRKYRYSLDRRDKKLVGVCSTLGETFGIDPTFIRLGFIAALFLISWEVALVTYVALGIYFSIQRKKIVDGQRRRSKSDFERMGESGTMRPSVHALRTELDENDRRMMAIDHHLNATNEELAREIEALREEK
jgi:phage shock protein PspC (stress-responsive transcriptional regulator)